MSQHEYNYNHEINHQPFFMRERLLKGAKVLRHHAAKPDGCQFDLSTWASPSPASPEMVEKHQKAGNMGMTYFHAPEVFPADYGGVNDAALQALPLPEVDCGTKACAFGLMALSKEFAADGLKAEYIPSSWNAQLVMLVPKFGNVTGFTAAEDFFGITDSDAAYLFDPSNYRNTPTEAEGELEVAERIEQFCNGYIDSYFHPDWTSEDDREQEDDFDEPEEEPDAEDDED